MRPRTWLLSCLPFLAGALLAVAAQPFGGSASADELAGAWALDKPAFQAEMRRVMEAELATMSEEERAEVEPSMEAMVEIMVRRLNATVELCDDGVAVIDTQGGDRTTGRWERQGDLVRLEADGDASLEGALEDGALRLRAEGEPTFEVVLRRP